MKPNYQECECKRQDISREKKRRGIKRKSARHWSQFAKSWIFLLFCPHLSLFLPSASSLLSPPPWVQTTRAQSPEPQIPLTIPPKRNCQLAPSRYAISGVKSHPNLRHLVAANGRRAVGSISRSLCSAVCAAIVCCVFLDFPGWRPSVKKDSHGDGEEGRVCKKRWTVWTREGERLSSNFSKSVTKVFVLWCSNFFRFSNILPFSSLTSSLGT